MRNNKKYIVYIVILIIIGSIISFILYVLHNIRRPAKTSQNSDFPRISKIFYLAGYPGDIKMKDFSTDNTIVLVKNNAGNFDVSKDGKKIIFSSRKTGEWQIYIADIKRDHLVNIQRISKKGHCCEDPRFFWNNKKIVYKIDDDIVVSYINGTIIKRITNTPNVEEWEPAVSPDGTIAFVRGNIEEEKGEIVLWKNGKEIEITAPLHCRYRRDFFYPMFRYDGALFFVGKCKDYEDDIFYVPPNSTTEIIRLGINAPEVSDTDPYPLFRTKRWLVFNSERGNKERKYEGYIGDLNTNRVFKIIKDTKPVLNPIAILANQ